MSTNAIKADLSKCQQCSECQQDWCQRMPARLISANASKTDGSEFRQDRWQRIPAIISQGLTSANDRRADSKRLYQLLRGKLSARKFSKKLIGSHKWSWERKNIGKVSEMFVILWKIIILWESHRMMLAEWIESQLQAMETVKERYFQYFYIMVSYFYWRYFWSERNLDCTMRWAVTVLLYRVHGTILLVSS